MKIIYPLLFSALIMLLSIHVHAGHLSDQLQFSAKLTGDQQVPMVDTDGVGVASFSLNATRDTLCVNATVKGLTGPLQAIHIHEGMPGMNGDVLVNLSDDIYDNRVIATVTGADLTPALLEALFAGNLYLNTHTEANPAGELRGQITLEKDWSFMTMLDSDQQTMEVESDGTGMAVVNLTRSATKLQVRAVFNDLTGPIAAAHLHMGAVGTDGGVVVDLYDLIDGNTIEGLISADLPEDLGMMLLDGMIYLNVHTDAFPNGEIRGQLAAAEGLAFDSWLNTEQEVGEVLLSDASGVASISVNNSLDEISYAIMATGLSGPLTGAHIHMGAVGEDGGVVINLSDDIMGNTIVGTLAGGELTSDILNTMLSGGTYLNLHTDLNPAGEIRGQVYRLAREGYTFSLESQQEVPAINANATGSGLVTMDRDQSELHVMVVVNDLSGPLTGAHFHQAPAGENGDVIYNLTPWFEATSTSDAAFGYWTDLDEAPFTAMNAVSVRNNEVYVNVHTEANAGGEVRGQVLRGAVCFSNAVVENGMIPVDPQFDGTMLFSAKLTGDQEVPAVDTDASGVAGLLLSEDMSELMVNINVDGLSGPITGAHIHQAVAGENGDVVINLSDFISGNKIQTTLTSFDLEPFLNGEYYINIHTDANAGGEIRGQIMLETDWNFTAAVDGMNSVPMTDSEGMGLGSFNLSSMGTDLEVRVVLDNLSGPITAIHLHNAPEGENGGVVSDLADLLSGTILSGSVDASEFIDELIAGNIYLNVHTDAFPNGEIRGQLMLQSGITMDAWMNGAQSVPSTATDAMGLATVNVSADLSTLNYTVMTTGLTNEIAAIHFHEGGLGENGGVLVDLSDGIDGNMVSGSMMDPEADAIAALLTGDVYVNLHTATFPNGAIRGQVYRLARDGYSFDICREQEVPETESLGYGGGIVSIDRNQSNAHVMFTTTALTGPITGAHFHEGATGENGDVIFNLTDWIVDNSAFGYLDSEMGFDATAADLFRSEQVYLNIHTDANAGGEIRGQVVKSLSCPGIPSSIESERSDLEVLIYPNPFQDQVTISFPAANYTTVTIRNILGKTVHTTSGTVGNVEVDLSGETDGVYFVTVQNSRNKATYKVIKR